MACQEAGLILRTTVAERQLIRSKLEKLSETAIIVKKGRKFDNFAQSAG
jgi:hypothetical protein